MAGSILVSDIASTDKENRERDECLGRALVRRQQRREILERLVPLVAKCVSTTGLASMAADMERVIAGCRGLSADEVTELLQCMQLIITLEEQ